VLAFYKYNLARLATRLRLRLGFNLGAYSDSGGGWGFWMGLGFGRKVNVMVGRCRMEAVPEAEASGAALSAFCCLCFAGLFGVTFGFYAPNRLFGNLAFFFCFILFFFSANTIVRCLPLGRL